MNFELNERQSSGKLLGIVAVVLLHLLIVYALVTGLARQALEVVRKPVLVAIVQEKPAAPAPKPVVQKAAEPPRVKAAAAPTHIRSPVRPRESGLHQSMVVQQAPVDAVSPVTGTAPSSVTAPAAPAAAATGLPGAPVHTSAVANTGDCAKPHYPESSRENEEEGTVTLEFLIGVDGSVLDSRVAKSSGSRALDRAAREALSLCRFKPATTDNKPVQSWTQMQYIWKLE